jgi:lipoprotein-anchoring transpeptidase ErfK/SrfK
VAISPANGTVDSATNQGVTVTVTKGKISNVTVTAGGTAVDGTLAPDATSWHTLWPLHTSTSYTVTVTAVGTTGTTTTTTSSFRTVAPAGTFNANTILGYHQVYGVGMPITIDFSQPVAPARRAAAERAISVTSSTPVVGAWMWNNGGREVAFRPQTYWPQHTQVSFDAHFTGLQIAPGVYGAADLTQAFTIGNSLIAVVSTRTHYMQVYYRNKLLGNWPVSTGMPGDDTANGTYLTIEKANPTRMVGNGYNVLVPLAVRFTWSGNYIHWAAWSVAQQGNTNVSHGCVNISPADAAIYYPLAVPGDPVTVTGSPAAGIWNDGYTEWFLGWPQLLAHSATHLAVQTGPSGSTLVDPSTLAPVTPAPLTQPPANDYLAG